MKETLLIIIGISLLFGCTSTVEIYRGAAGPGEEPLWTVKNPVDEVSLEQTTTEGETVNTVKLVVKKETTDGNPITWAFNLVIKSFNFVMEKADIQLNTN